MRRPRSLRQIAVAVVVLLAVWAIGRLDLQGTAGSSAPGAPDLLSQAIAEQRSDVWVEASGVVVKVLPDDERGSRHQRFLLEIPSGDTILIAHNIDLAPRIDSLQRGDRLAFRGEFEWNDRGGVVHWTHHDPGGRPGGWLEHRGRRYE